MIMKDCETCLPIDRQVDLYFGKPNDSAIGQGQLPSVGNGTVEFYGPVAATNSRIGRNPGMSIEDHMKAK